MLVNDGNGNRIRAQSKGKKTRLFCGEYVMRLLVLSSASFCCLPVNTVSEYCIDACAYVIKKH